MRKAQPCTHVGTGIEHGPEMAGISLKRSLPQCPLAGGDSTFIKGQGLFAAASVFGEENEGIGAVGTNSKGFFRKLDLPHLILILVRKKQNVMGFGKRSVLLARRQLPNQLPHGPFN